MKIKLLRIICLFLALCPLPNFAQSRPLIGITPSFSNNSIQLNNDYVNAINENGGMALILPPTNDEIIIQSYVNMLDGAVFSGGPDIPPEFYGQSPHHTTKTMESGRFDFERRFIKAYLDSGKPALGICLGMQFSNVVTGGTLLQDIPELVSNKICHRNGEMYTNFHSIGIARGSLLNKILGTTSARIISRHHQALEKVADLFEVSARSSDGVIEAVERKDGPFGIFVQWHPESMKDADLSHRNRLFSALIEASRNIKATRDKN